MNQIIGIDHGFFQMKTPNSVFISGVNESHVELPNMQDILHVEGKAYQVGNKRKNHELDKTKSQDYYLLTLAAIAKEIKARNLPKEAAVHLAVGLPLSQYQREHKKFRAYLMGECKPVYYVYDNEQYAVTIENVSVYVQGYAAIVYGWISKAIKQGEPRLAVVDIGGGTTDTFIIQNDRPQAETMRSYKAGVISMYSEIKRMVDIETGATLEDTQIEHYLRKKQLHMPQEVKSLIDKGNQAFSAEILGKLSESGIDLQYTPLVFIGGGASIIKRYLLKELNPDMTVFIDDVCANAKGYEILTKAALRQSAGE